MRFNATALKHIGASSAQNIAGLIMCGDNSCSNTQRSDVLGNFFTPDQYGLDDVKIHRIVNYHATCL